MLNIEEILIKIMQLLDFNMQDIKLKQSVEKKRFITKEESNTKYREHLELISKSLKIKDNNKFIDTCITLLYLYNSIYHKLSHYPQKGFDKKLHWIILKRLIVPFLACNIPILNNKNIEDKIFWYLPEVDDKDIKFPTTYLMKSWLKLYGKGLDSLCNEIDKEYFCENKATSSIDTLKPWLYKSISPSKKSIELYLNMSINYDDVSKSDYVKNVLINKFLIGRFTQDLYNKLITYFKFNNSINIEENKILQLIHQYKTLYHIQKKILKKENLSQVENEFKSDMLDTFNHTKLENIVHIIYREITIEFDYNINNEKLEDIHQIKKIFTDNNLHDMSEETKLQNHFSEYDNIHYGIQKYKSLNECDYLKSINKETNFKLLENLDIECNKHYPPNYKKLEAINLRMLEVANTSDEKQQSLEYILNLYCGWQYKENEYQKDNAEKFIKDYESILKLNMVLEIKEEEILLFKAYFYLKSKLFKESLEYFDEYYNKFINQQKKHDSNIIFIYLSAYCAYTTHNKVRLKIYNKYLKKTNSKEFKTKSSLPFPIYSYK